MITFRKSVVVLLLIIFVVAIALKVFLSRESTADIVFINGVILTVDHSNTVAQAVAVENGTIVAVGSNEDVQSYIDAGVGVVDLIGKTLIPGFIDAHGHFPFGAASAVYVDLGSPPIGKIETMAQLRQALAVKVADTPKGDWVMGFGYDDTLLAELRHPTREDLDAISTEHPIWISHTSGHLGVANTLALAVGDIDDATADPEGGHIQRDQQGVANGILEETAIELVALKVPLPNLFQFSKILSEASQDYLSQGVTTAQAGILTEEQLKIFSMVSRLKQTPLRLVAWPDLAAGLRIVDEQFTPGDFNTDFFQVGAIKLFADGSIQGYTGHLTEPYYSSFKGDSEHVGYARTSLEDLTEQLTKFHAAGLQVAVHTNGDAAMDNLISAFEVAQLASPRPDARLISIHAQMARDDQLDSMVRLGITPSFFGLHVYYWGDRHVNIFIGPERGERISPAKSAVDRDLRFTLHADTPVVPMNPLLQMWVAVNRVSYLGTEIGAGNGELKIDQRITALQALRASTIDAAWQVFLEHHRGSIEVGKVADFAVLSENPLSVPTTIDDIQVEATYIDGYQVYARP